GSTPIAVASLLGADGRNMRAMAALAVDELDSIDVGALPVLVDLEPADRPSSPSSLTLAAAVLGFFVITLDAVVVNVALPSIGGGVGDGRRDRVLVRAGAGRTADAGVVAVDLLRQRPGRRCGVVPGGADRAIAPSAGAVRLVRAGDGCAGHERAHLRRHRSGG